MFRLDLRLRGGRGDGRQKGEGQSFHHWTAPGVLTHDGARALTYDKEQSSP
jgi:hypothetical protein